MYMHMYQACVILFLKKENFFWIVVQDLKQSLEKLVKHVNNLASLEDRVNLLEKCVQREIQCSAKSPDKEDKCSEKISDEAGEDFDLFGSDSEASECISRRTILRLISLS